MNGRSVNVLGLNAMEQQLKVWAQSPVRTYNPNYSPSSPPLPCRRRLVLPGASTRTASTFATAASCAPRPPPQQWATPHPSSWIAPSGCSCAPLSRRTHRSPPSTALFAPRQVCWAVDQAKPDGALKLHGLSLEKPDSYLYDSVMVLYRPMSSCLRSTTTVGAVLFLPSSSQREVSFHFMSSSFIYVVDYYLTQQIRIFCFFNSVALIVA